MYMQEMEKKFGTYLGKCVKTKTLFSGAILSLSLLHLSINCLQTDLKTACNRVFPKTKGVS